MNKEFYQVMFWIEALLIIVLLICFFMFYTKCTIGGVV